MGVQKSKRKEVVPGIELFLGTLTSGNLLKADSSGNLVDSGLAASSSAQTPVGTSQLDPQTLQYAKVTLTAAQVKALSGTPITLIAAPGAGKAIFVQDIMLYLNFGTTAFAAGSTFEIQHNSINIATTTAALINGIASALIQPAYPGIGTTQSDGVTNNSVTVTVAGANFTTGDSTVDIHIWYAAITA